MVAGAVVNNRQREGTPSYEFELPNSGPVLCMVQIRRKAIWEASSHVEGLMLRIDAAVGNFEETDWRKAAVSFYEKLPTADDQGIIRDFPNDPGIYALVRYYVTNGKRHPRVLYVGISPKAGLKRRLTQHFGRKRSHPDFYDGSRFVNAVWEIVQDEDAVYRILSNDNTRVAIEPIPGASEIYLNSLERLAIQALNPLLNVEKH